ncbi:MAG: RICIN domain-containing protein [Clostridia bacterium]|nr:RICIN domain-containing protein [Clostridia bacterium]
MKKNRLIIILLTCLLLLSGIPVSSAEGFSDVTEPEQRPKEQGLTDGVYRLRNAETGLYLDAGDGKKTPVTLKAANKDSVSQCFLIEKHGDGTYTLSPRGNIGADGDSGFMLSCPSTSAGSLPSLEKTDVKTESSSFDICVLKNGSFTLAPSFGDNFYAVLYGGQTEKDAVYAPLTVEDYMPGDTAASFYPEPVGVTGVTVAFKETKLRLYSSGTFYARVLPYGPDSSAVWKSSDDSVLLVSSSGSYTALSEGVATVTASAGDSSASFTVTVVDKDAFTFYSQNNMTGSDWDASLLDKLYCVGGGYKKIFAIDDKLPGGKSAWIDKGCSICSFAMVLHNMDAKLTVGYDFRSGQNGMLPADPYTVALANTANIGAQRPTDVLYGNPVYVAWARIAEAFEVDGTQLAVRRVYNGSRAVIKQLLDAHPQGIIAMLCRGENTHYVVISRCLNPDAKYASQYEFEFYDAAAYLRSEGDGVGLKETTSNRYMYYSYASIAALIIIDTPENINK